MRSLLRLPRTLRWIAPILGLAVCGVFAKGIAQAQTSCVTTITGKVYSPLGPANGGDPIPNILVYMAQGTVQPFVLDSGPQSCMYQQSLVTGAGVQPIENTTGADGTFTMTTNQITTSGPQNFVIQAGKWRRQYPGTQITACTTNNIGPFTMPANQSQGDLPHIALVTGSVDGAECIFHQIGISDSEVSTQAGGGSINLYKGAYSTGVSNPDTTTANPTLSETALVGNLGLMDTYDVIMFACQGGYGQSAVTAANQQNLLDFTNIGGRVFATHWEYIWLNNIFPTVADWNIGGSSGPLSGVSGTAMVDQSWENGIVLTQWLHDIGADTGTPGQISLSEVDSNTSGVYKPPAQSWAKFNSASTASQVSVQFTFDTPLNTAGIPAVTIAYTNTTQTFKPGDIGDTVVITAMNISSTPTTAGLSMAITLPAGLTATSATDPTGTWTCTLTPSITCTEPVAVASNASDSVMLVFNIAGSEPVGLATISTALSGGGISGTGQCGRVLYNDYHVENQRLPTPIPLYPNECSAGSVTAQEKFLEYSLYDLSNFIATNTTDLITIAGTPIITWATPAAIPYGVALGATQLDATATFAGTAVAGTFAYTPPAGTILPLGNNTLSVQFTPSNATNYTSASGTVVQAVVQDASSVALTSGTNPSYLGQSVTFTAQVSTNGAIAAGQTVNFYDGLTQIGTGTTSGQGAATYTTTALIVGTHNVTACLVASADFGASCSPALVQLVTLIPTPPLTTSSVLTSNANPATLGQSVTFTVGVATTGAFSTVPSGMVRFFDGTTQIGQGTLGLTGFTAFTTSGLALGTHTITAVYGGNATLASSTSNVVLELVLTSLPSAGTGFLLTVDPTSLSMGVGRSTVLNVSVLSLNNYKFGATLTCTGGPSGSTCNFANANIPVGGGVTTLTFGVAAPHACGTSTPYFTATSGMRRGAPWLAMGVLGLLFAGRRRKRLAQGLTLVLVLCVLPMLSGCGGTCTDFGTQPATYTFTVTATPANVPAGAAGAKAQSQVVTVKVHL